MRSFVQINNLTTDKLNELHRNKPQFTLHTLLITACIPFTVFVFENFLSLRYDFNAYFLYWCSTPSPYISSISYDFMVVIKSFIW